jgi:predicted nucleic acid-binding protein
LGEARLICCDTSFLFALYGNDAHTPAAIAEVKRRSQSVTLSILNEYELANALRLAEFRKLISVGTAARYLADFEADVAGGNLIVANCNLASVVARARRLSVLHTSGGGHRAFDILHISAALEIGADDFLSFDRAQRKLAASEGLAVAP